MIDGIIGRGGAGHGVLRQGQRCLRVSHREGTGAGAAPQDLGYVVVLGGDALRLLAQCQRLRTPDSPISRAALDISADCRTALFHGATRIGRPQIGHAALTAPCSRRRVSEDSCDAGVEAATDAARAVWDRPARSASLSDRAHLVIRAAVTRS